MMSEQFIKSVIGEDTEATVYFDYMEGDTPTHDYPGCDAEVIINAVMVGNGDFTDDLKPAAITRLMEECFEAIRKGTSKEVKS